MLTYTDIKKRGQQIAIVTQSRYMPPWKAFSDCEFRDNRSLTEAQIDTLRRWVEAGMPEGSAADRPVIPKFTNGSLLGPPDQELKAQRTAPFSIVYGTRKQARDYRTRSGLPSRP